MNDEPKNKTSPEENPVNIQKQSQVGINWLTLVLTLMAISLSGWALWQQQSFSGNDSSLTFDSEIQSLQRNLAKLEGSTDYNAENIQQLASRLDSQGGRMDALPLRMEKLEIALDAIPASERQASSRMLSLEAEWYLRLAESQLTVARNVPATQAALSLADERFAQLSEPSLTPIRNRIATAIGELQIQQQHPIAADSALIQKIIEQIPKFKLLANVQQNYGNSEAGIVETEGTERAMAAISNAFSNIISVKRSDSEVIPQLDDADAAILRRSLLLELQTAKMALLQNETTIYTQSLNVAKSSLVQWFDNDTSDVTEAIASIDKLLDAPANRQLPDIAAIRSDLARLQSAAQ